jgi:lathosterol oxidase
MIHFLLFVISNDIWFYFLHMFLHKPRVYVTLHKEHHSVDPSTLQPLDAYVGHVLEKPLESVGIFIPLVFVPFYFKSFLLAVALINVRNMLRHDKNSVWLIGNHHILHHKYRQYNYGEYWLDKMLGTAYPHEEECEKSLIYI